MRQRFLHFIFNLILHFYEAASVVNHIKNVYGRINFLAYIQSLQLINDCDFQKIFTADHYYNDFFFIPTAKLQSVLD